MEKQKSKRDMSQQYTQLFYLINVESMETTSSRVFWVVISAPLGVSSRVWKAVSARVLQFMVSLTTVERACNIKADERLPLSSENRIIVSVTIGYLSLLLCKNLQRPECGQRPECMTGQLAFMGLWVPVVWVFVLKVQLPNVYVKAKSAEE